MTSVTGLPAGGQVLQEDGDSDEESTSGSRSVESQEQKESSDPMEQSSAESVRDDMFELSQNKGPGQPNVGIVSPLPSPEQQNDSSRSIELAASIMQSDESLQDMTSPDLERSDLVLPEDRIKHPAPQHDHGKQLGSSSSANPSFNRRLAKMNNEPPGDNQRYDGLLQIDKRPVSGHVLIRPLVVVASNCSGLTSSTYENYSSRVESGQGVHRHEVEAQDPVNAAESTPEAELDREVNHGQSGNQGPVHSPSTQLKNSLNTETGQDNNHGEGDTKDAVQRLIMATGAPNLDLNSTPLPEDTDGILRQLEQLKAIVLARHGTARGSTQQIAGEKRKAAEPFGAVSGNSRSMTPKRVKQEFPAEDPLQAYIRENCIPYPPLNRQGESSSKPLLTAIQQGKARES